MTPVDSRKANVCRSCCSALTTSLETRQMKIYDWAAAPNPKRLRMFLVEKGITNIEIV